MMRQGSKATAEIKAVSAAQARPIAGLRRAEQIVVWALRHTAAMPRAGHLRRAELSNLTRTRAGELETAFAHVVASAVAARIEIAAPLPLRATTQGEEQLLAALRAFHANQPDLFAAAIAALAPQDGGEFAACTTTLAALLEECGAVLAWNFAAYVMPAAAAAAQWRH
jgi:hypothetical protein